jgi:hypothetical protein
MNPNVAAPEPQTAITQTPEVTLPTVVVEPTILSQRQQAYSNYDALYAQPVAPASVVPIAEPGAPVPVVETPVPQFTDTLALQATIAQLQAEVAALKPKPVALPVVEVAKAPMESWVELMAQSKYTEAEELLFRHFAPRIQAYIQPQLVQQAAASANAEREIQSFITDFERSNTDLLSMRDYVIAGSERRLLAAQNEGKIKSPADFVTEYKAAVTTEANELRVKLQLARGAGRDEALVTRREVLSATTLEPTAIQMPQNNTKPAPMSNVDYIAMRQNRTRILNGM